MHPRRILLVFMLFAALGCGDKVTQQKPAPASIQPGAACAVQKTSALTLAGSGFSPLPSKTLTDQPALLLPQITLSQTEDLDGQSASSSHLLPDDPDGGHVRWASQQQMAFDIYPELALPTGLYDIQVQNADGESGTLPGALLLVPAPVAGSAAPDLVCSQAAHTVTVSGDDFIQAGTALPTVNISGGSLTSAMSVKAGSLADCRALPGSSGLQACKTLVFNLAPGALAPDNYSLTVSNPDPVGCTSSNAVPLDLTVVPPPTVTSVSSDLICTADGAVNLTITGTGFIESGTSQPTVALNGGASASAPLPATVVDASCTAITGPADETAKSCTQLTVAIPSSVAAGSYQVVVNNPASVGCASADDVSVVVVPGPAIASLAPAEACNSSSATQVVATGTNFMKVGGALPTVSIAGQSLTADSVANCTPVQGVSETATACTSLTFTLPQAAASTLGDGSQPVVIHNPAPANCASPTPSCPAAQCLDIVPPPVLASIAPTQICGNGGQLTLTGTGLQDGTLSLAPSSGPAVTAAVTASADGTSATAAVPQLDPGTYTATYAIAGGTCSAQNGAGASFSQTFTVVPGPQLFFADPRVVYNGITTEVTFYGASITGTVQSLGIRDASGTVTPLTNINYTAGANLVRADVPAGQAPGTYTVVLTDDSACDAEMPGGLVVTGSVSSGIASITPPFGYKLASTAVTITGTAHGTFQPLPQAYLNPHSAAAGVVATPIRALSLNEPSDTSKPDTLTGLVAPIAPGTPLTVGLYDLIVVNPDGSVEFLDSAFTVTDTPPPTISSVSPGSFPGGTATPLTVTGTNFAQGATLSLVCATAGTSTPTTPVNGTAVTVDAAGDSVSGSVNVPVGDVCVVRVTNPDGTYADFASVVTTNASGNLSAFQPGPDMVTARAELQATAGNATSAARFLYAIGGNDGTGVLSSVESSAVDQFGTPVGFASQRYPLTEGSADAGAVVPRERGTAVTVGRFVYLVGGTSDGTTPLNTVDRAEILDPAESPQVTDLGLTVDYKSGGLSPGVWYYRIAAVMDPADANNPGGETIAGDAFGLQLCNPDDATSPTYCPNLAGEALDVTLTWSTVPDAVAYRIYRTASPDQTPDQTVLLAEVPASTSPLAYTDNGKAAPGTQAPLEVGALGRWSTVATLATGRIAPAVTSAVDPGDATKVYLYAFGGLTASGPAADYEIVPLALGTDGFGRPAQTVGTVTAGNSNLETKSGPNTVDLKEWLNLAFVGTHETAPTVPAGQEYVYVGPGATDSAGSTDTTTVNYATLSANSNGQLSALAIFGTAYSGGNEGYGGTLEAGYLNFFGGGSSNTGPSPSTTFTAAQLCGPGVTGCTVTTPTDAKSFNANGSNLSGTTGSEPARVEMGTAVQSGTIYVLGGWTGPTTEVNPTRSIVYTYW